MSTYSCKTCHFSFSASESKFLCQRYPPNLSNDPNKKKCLYPALTEFDWCGEWQSQPNYSDVKPKDKEIATREIIFQHVNRALDGEEYQRGMLSDVDLDNVVARITGLVRLARTGMGI